MIAALTAPRTRLAVEALLVLLLVLAALRLAFSLAATPALPMDAPAALARPDLGVLTRFDPFFRGEAAPAASSSTSDWTLHAVRAGGGNFDSAIIAGSDGRQEVYRVGEALAPGVILAEVAQDHVQIARGGGRLRLNFPETANAIVASPAPAEPSQATAPISPSRFVAEASLSPRQRGDRIEGYTLQPRGRGQTLAAAGLQAGDVILSINGMPMNPERATDLAVEMSAGATAQLEYERDGQRRRADLRIQQADPTP